MQTTSPPHSAPVKDTNTLFANKRSITVQGSYTLCQPPMPGTQSRVITSQHNRKPHFPDVLIKIQVLWDEALWSLVKICRCFGWASSHFLNCLKHGGKLLRNVGKYLTIYNTASHPRRLKIFTHFPGFSYPLLGLYILPNPLFSNLLFPLCGRQSFTWHVQYEYNR